MDKRPGGKNGSGKKWKESLVCFGKDGKKPGVFFLGLIHIKINDQPFDFKMFFGT